MNSFFEPDPVVLAFFFVKQFGYLGMLSVLALLRVIGGRGIARWPALVVLVMALAGVLTAFAPALDLHRGPAYAFAAQMMAGGGGMTALLVPSVIFLIGAVIPRARWRWIDVVHILMLTGLLGLWWWTS